ncbi:DEAD/DEAH box helicase [Oligoflexus tunisiensis]|uniref:DEAD/DEAH box helicase n=1 Tax=Oligoflexus tunisiensis TaxID=708132 RepID=UPI00114C91D6|nr:DEAD/DEAH box helicase [Oligoflexus tunisiensis]
MKKKRRNGPKRGDDNAHTTFRNPSRPRPPVEPIEDRIPPHEREQLRKVKQITDTALHKWLREAESNARKPRKDISHVPLMDQLDPWQKEAFDALLNGEHVIVDAPTTAGKTRVVEAFFEIHIDQPRFRAAYTTPVKSLSNDKLREFSDKFGKENVGIATGDIKENLGAPIVVATLESYRNSLLGVEPDLGRTLVVFDEYHFMQDSSRGSAWEEAIILTPPTCQLLLLSASVDNAEQFCAWITAISGRPCRLIQTRERPVPLVDLIFFREQWLLVSEVEDILPKKSPTPSRFPLEHSEIGRRLKSIPALGLTPCIIYAGRRAACESMAIELCKQLEPLSREEAQRIRELIENDPDVEEPMKFITMNLRRLLLVYGVAWHHSGMAPYARRAIENLVKNGQLRFCVATMGLSIGINFSVRSTLISDYTRPGETGFTTYASSEVLQMLGRAGRRGKDVVGFSLWPSVAAWQKFGGTRRDRCHSRLKNDPTTFLGLLGRGFKLRDVENFYEKSFLRFGDKTVRFALIREQPLKKALAADSLPCGVSPAAAFADFLDEKPEALCLSCPLRERCHAHIQRHMASSLAQLHIHLHRIGCIDDREQLTRYGSIARYFPQSGGLLIAQLIDQRDLTVDNLLAGLELMAALCLTRFKEPDIGRDYDFPFASEKVEERLVELYPVDLFEELYDSPGQRRETFLFREYNPLAGSVLNDWARGMSWTDLVHKTTDERFGQGDLMALIYRAATYLQSLSQARVPGLGQAAAVMRDQLLREPLMPSSHRLVEEDDEEPEILAAEDET